MVVGALPWIALSLSVVAVVTGFFTPRVQLSLACTASASTLLGVGMLLERLDLKSAIWASVMFGFAATVLIVAAIKERNEHAREEVEQGQVHGQGTEGSGD